MFVTAESRLIGKKSPVPPVVRTAVRLQLEDPMLLTTNFTVLVEPTATSPKGKLVRLILIARPAESGTPKPVREITGAGPAPLSKIVADPVTKPPVGLNLKLRLVAAPGAIIMGSVVVSKFVKFELPE